MRKPGWKGVQLEGKKGAFLLFLLLFGLIFLRFCTFGLQYYVQLDDYIQLHNQAAYYSAKSVILDMGLLSSRPLASVMDYFFWSHFWPCLMAAVALIAALFAASGLLLRSVWREYFGTGFIFLVVYTLLPLGMEGTYWLSASNRVAPSLFFTALAMWLFQRWCRQGKWGWLAGYFGAQLVSFCFYEQGLVLCVTGVLLVALLELRAHKRRALGGLLTFVNVGIYFAFTSAFAVTGGQLGSRLKLTLPWQEGWPAVFGRAAKQTWDAYFVGLYKTMFRGFRRGLGFLMEDFNLLWALAVAALCVLLFFWARRFTEEGKRTGLAMAVGFLMLLAPITLFFVLSDPSIALRNTVFSFCGLALMADALFGLCFRKIPGRNAAAGALCALFALGSAVCAVSELHDYRETYENDQRAAKAIVEALPDIREENISLRIGVLNLAADYLPEQNYKYHQHIHGATESPWALRGMLVERSGYRDWLYTAPLPPGMMYPPSDGSRRVSSFDFLVLYDPETGTAQEVWAERTGEEAYEIYDAAGTLLARTWEENGAGYLALAGNE